MAASSKLISFIIPTLNSGTVLDHCLKSISSQNFDQNQIEILIVDGGSTDNTVSISHKYNCIIINNPLKTAESAKSLGIKSAHGQYVALVDSDNILPTHNWLKKMLLPFKNKNIIGTEPWEYTYRQSGGFIERYSALSGVNDPYALISNIYDRQNKIRKSWNGLSIKVKNYPSYQTFSINQPLPSIGANGTIYRRSDILKYFDSPYLIDIDLLSIIASKTTNRMFAKVKVGIIHSYCESSISKFISKQNRRVTDLYVYQSSRPKSFVSSQFWNNIKFSFYVVLILPMLIDTVRGYLATPDPAWLFHPLACTITLYIYGINTIKYRLGLLTPIDRSVWHQ